MGFSKLKIPKICEFCEKAFEAKTVTTRFCSKYCSEKETRRQKRNAKDLEEKKSLLEKSVKKIAEIQTRPYISVSEAVMLFGMSKDINLFLDNDNAGIKCKSLLIKSFPEVKDHSDIYSNHKDLNEFLMHRINNNASINSGKNSIKFTEADKTEERKPEPEIKNSNSFKMKR